MESRQDNQQRVPDQGEVLVTLLPVNEKLPWITPAKFRPELVPEELMTPVLTVNLQKFRSDATLHKPYVIASITITLNRKTLTLIIYSIKAILLF